MFRYYISLLGWGEYKAEGPERTSEDKITDAILEYTGCPAEKFTFYYALYGGSLILVKQGSLPEMTFLLFR